MSDCFQYKYMEFRMAERGEEIREEYV